MHIVRRLSSCRLFLRFSVPPFWPGKCLHDGQDGVLFDPESAAEEIYSDMETLLTFLFSHPRADLHFYVDGKFLLP